jgi:hypothetical protein
MTKSSYNIRDNRCARSNFETWNTHNMVTSKTYLLSLQREEITRKKLCLWNRHTVNILPQFSVVISAVSRKMKPLVWLVTGCTTGKSGVRILAGVRDFMFFSASTVPLGVHPALSIGYREIFPVSTVVLTCMWWQVQH